MKRTLLIALFIAITFCLFSLTAYASNEVTLVDGSTADFRAVFNVDSKNEVLGFNSGYTKNDVTDVVFPDEINGIESNFLFNKSTSINSLTFEATDTFFISGDAIFSGCSVKKITFNPDCIVEIRKGNFSDCKSLTEITFPKFKMLAGSAFGYCPNMVSTNELILAEGLTEIGGHAFHDCISLTGAVYFPSTLQTIQEYSFENTGFTNFDLSKCANLTSVGGGYGGPFTNNDSITTLDLSGCVKLTTLKNSFAQGCDNLTKVILPPNLESVPHKAFAHCYKLQSIVLPKSVTYVADEAFHSARGGQDLMTFTVYIQSNVQFHETYPFRDSGAKIEFVLIDKDVTGESFKAANTFAAITNASVVDYLDPSSPWTYLTGGSIDDNVIVENYCKYLAIDGEHFSRDNNPCVIMCEYCESTVAKKNPIHSEYVDIVFENGFDKEGARITACSNKGCLYTVSVPTEALFTCLGYSALENEVGGISISFKINNEEIENYEKTTKREVSYGMFAASKSAVSNNDIFNENGAALSGVVAAKIQKGTYLNATIKMTGLATPELKEYKFALGAFIKISEENTVKYSYMQYGTPNKSEKYYYISYNDIVTA